jgi:tetratricopeptide (TPR) repeat protein
METVRFGIRGGLLLAALLLLTRPVASAPVPKEIPEGLRRQALALNDVTGDDTIKAEIKTLIAKPKEARALLDAAVTMAKDKNQPFNSNAATILANTGDKLDHFDAAQTFYRLCVDEAVKLKSGYKLAEAYLGLTGVLFRNKKYAECEKFCREFLGVEDEDAGRYRPFILPTLAQTLAQLGKKEEALKRADSYLKWRNDFEGYRLKYMVLHHFGMDKEAVQTCEQALKQIAKDNDTDAKRKADQSEALHYILSNIYIDLGDVNKATEHLQANLKVKPDDPTYNNDLGYIWADHDMNLDEAEKMIRKALDEDRKQRKSNPDLKAEDDKDNAAYLDSLGWVLYKKKQYKEAKDALLQAVKDKEGQHIEIFDHLGDIYTALGDKKEAVKAWKKGLEVVGDTKREKERKAIVEKKLKAAEEK